MQHHLLFVSSAAQLAFTRTALNRMGAKPVADRSTVAECYHLEHPLLERLVLNIYLVSELDAITPHLRQNPVDLLIYDERNGGIEARAALAKIRDDVFALSELWGPDFVFPMSRVVAILEREENDAIRAFELGRVQVRDVCVAPKSTATVLLWLKRILTHGVFKKEKVGIALTGGGLEGFLYQTGVLHALNKALTHRTLRQIDCFSGISSGSICAALLCANVSTAEVIRAMHGKSDVLEPLTGSLLFDVAGRDILRRMLKESLTWAGIDPTKWVRKVLQAIPTGFFKGEAIRLYFKTAIEIYGYEDSFQGIGKELYIGATDQDTFEHVTFGKPPWTNVAISDALRASCGLPPFFTPVQINGRWFIDGQVTKSVNLELLVERDCRLIIIVDPMKPLATLIPGSVDRRGGVYSIMQTVKALVSTRFQSSLQHMTERFPDVDFLVFQPDEECAQLMAGSPMRYRLRTELVNMAYRQTLRQLRERHHVYSAKLKRFGFELRPPEHLKELERQDADAIDSVA